MSPSITFGSQREFERGYNALVNNILNKHGVPMQEQRHLKVVFDSDGSYMGMPTLEQYKEEPLQGIISQWVEPEQEIVEGQNDMYDRLAEIMPAKKEKK